MLCAAMTSTPLEEALRDDIQLDVHVRKLTHWLLEYTKLWKRPRCVVG